MLINRPFHITEVQLFYYKGPFTLICIHVIALRETIWQANERCPFKFCYLIINVDLYRGLTEESRHKSKKSDSHTKFSVPSFK